MQREIQQATLITDRGRARPDNVVCTVALNFTTEKDSAEFTASASPGTGPLATAVAAEVRRPDGYGALRVC